MPPVRTMPTMKPTKTERSHEENQERAYVAASRRSDRSLEARVESARRASEIHKKRTGRSLRVTEQDVINEEMYEEEDDDLPWQYRRMGILGDFNLNVLDPELRNKVQAQIAYQVERSKLIQDVVASMQQGNPQMAQSPQSYQSQPHYMNPGLMQAPQAPYQNGHFAPHMQHRSPSYHHTPYPAQHSQQPTARPNLHQRSASIATPQDPSIAHIQPSQAAHTAPAQASQIDNRRMSLPPQLSPVHQRTPLPSKTVPIPSGSSATKLSPQRSSDAYQLKRGIKRPASPSQEQRQRPNSFAGPYVSGNNSTRHEESSYGPLTPSIPMETHGLLGPVYPGMTQLDFASNNNVFDGMMQPQQQFYSYNPNGKKESKPFSQPMGTKGLDQTLMPTSLDTQATWNNNGSVYDSPASANSHAAYSSSTEPGYGYGFDKSFTFDLFNMDNSTGHNSGQVTPGDDFASFIDGTMFSSQPTAF